MHLIAKHRRTVSWLVPVLMCLASAAIAWAVSVRIAAVYTSRASVYISTSGATSLSQMNDGSLYIKDHMKSYSQVATSSTVLNAVAQRLGNPGGGTALQDRVSATVAENSVILEISARSDAPLGTQRLCQAAAEEAAAAVVALPGSTSAGSYGVRAQVISVATMPETPTSPNVRMNQTLGALFGLALGLMTVHTLYRFNSAMPAAGRTADHASETCREDHTSAN